MSPSAPPVGVLVTAVTVLVPLALDPIVPAEVVITPALKLPLASRATIAEAVLALVAVVALLETLLAVLMVASFVSTIAALALMSALTMLVPRDSLLYAIAALALISALTIAPLVIDVTPVSLMVISPETDVPVATLELLPNIILPLLNAASLL